MKNNFHHQT